MEVGVDEARHHDLPGDIDFPEAAILTEGPDDAVAADRDVGGDEVAGHEVEETASLEHEIRFGAALPLCDDPPEDISLCHRAPQNLPCHPPEACHGFDPVGDACGRGTASAEACHPRTNRSSRCPPIVPAPPPMAATWPAPAASGAPPA